MKTITVNAKTITFDIGEELRAKDLAKIQKVQVNARPGEEIDMMFGIVREFCSKEDLETVENMSINDFMDFSTQFAEIINFDKSIKVSDEKKNVS